MVVARNGRRRQTVCDPVRCEGGIVTPLWDRQYCTDGDKVDGLCYPRCPAGMSRVAGAPTVCRSNGVASYGRGVGDTLKCAAGKSEDSAGLCYNAAPSGFSKQSLGLVSQNCPPGTQDFGVGCTRESYSREGTFPYKVEMRPTRKEILADDA